MTIPRPTSAPATHPAASIDHGAKRKTALSPRGCLARASSAGGRTGQRRPPSRFSPCSRLLRTATRRTQIHPFHFRGSRTSRQPPRSHQCRCGPSCASAKHGGEHGNHRPSRGTYNTFGTLEVEGSQTPSLFSRPSSGVLRKGDVRSFGSRQAMPNDRRFAIFLGKDERMHRQAWVGFDRAQGVLTADCAAPSGMLIEKYTARLGPYCGAKTPTPLPCRIR